MWRWPPPNSRCGSGSTPQASRSRSGTASRPAAADCLAATVGLLVEVLPAGILARRKAAQLPLLVGVGSVLELGGEVDLVVGDAVVEDDLQRGRVDDQGLVARADPDRGPAAAEHVGPEVRVVQELQVAFAAKPLGRPGPHRAAAQDRLRGAVLGEHDARPNLDEELAA